MVAIQLRKKYKKQVYFYNQNVEIDFYIPEEALGIQVSYSLHDPETEKREINAFLKISGLLNLDRIIIITKDEKRSIPIAENKSIEVIPIWEWLLAIP